MIDLLVWLLVAVVAFGAVYMVVKLVPLEEWMKRAALIIIGAIFLILLIVKVVVPLLSTMPTP